MCGSYWIEVIYCLITDQWSHQFSQNIENSDPGREIAAQTGIKQWHIIILYYDVTTFMKSDIILKFKTQDI